MITELRPNQVFVFGSNLAGHHAGGAARQAYEQFGAEWGVGAGLTGQCYGIPTMGGLDEIHRYVRQFLRVAELLPQYEFLLTRIGTGIANHSVMDIAPMFIDLPFNVKLPQEFIDYLDGMR
ncbi:A1S_2505 family phage non-structural protein [Rhodococcus qingshengii]|uniref:A1S_2505 family phage non-structural protein n=1 Tax=Rhodococcus qingshengii TaxID=334542 RepID=UPI002942CC83|nr:hypothetical protein [Rhodococcus qingshengii]WOI85967.1 hypothetical protein R0122_22575 [Rhodococcus qingshengii]